MVAMVVVDVDSCFRSTFEVMCNILKMIFWSLSHGNHKENNVYHYHRFLNKTQTIGGQDRGRHKIFHQNIKTSQYAWNSAKIDDTYILRCVVPVGREFRFLLDIDLLEQPSLNNKENSTLIHYQCNVSCYSKFSISVLQTLIEEHCSANRDRWNKSRVAYKFNKEDVVKAHIQVQSKLDNGEVGKLSYRACGPF